MLDQNQAGHQFGSQPVVVPIMKQYISSMFVKIYFLTMSRRLGDPSLCSRCSVIPIATRTAASPFNDYSQNQ
jgi:hypothetical protein